MCHMKHASVRDLHLNTSALIKAVSEGESFIIDKRGVAVAELRPIQATGIRKLPNREAFIASLKLGKDSGRILEEDRS